jgi:uncharacterized damage-inducible protein DinB
MDIRNQTDEILSQVLELINQLNDEQYTASLPVLSNSSVGKHVRHIVEFYQCLTNGLSGGCVNYDNRERNLLLETKRECTQNAIKIIINYVTIIQDNPLLLSHTYNDTVSTLNTSVFRELAYNIEHTVHHLAIIKIGINSNFAEVSLPQNMGIANSTVKYQQELVNVK